MTQHEAFDSAQPPGEALTEAELRLARAPDDPAAQFQKAYALLVLDRLAECEVTIERLCAEFPAYPDARWLLAGVLRRNRGENDPEVLAAYEQALESDPQNPYVRSEYASLLRATGRYNEAFAVYSELCAPGACEDEELRMEVGFQLGAVAQALGDYGAALAAYRAVLAIDPDHHDAMAMVELLAD